MAVDRTLSERADELEFRQMKELGDRLVTKSLLYNLADGDQSLGNGFGQGTVVGGPGGGFSSRLHR